MTKNFIVKCMYNRSQVATICLIGYGGSTYDMLNALCWTAATINTSYTTPYGAQNYLVSKILAINGGIIPLASEYGYIGNKFGRWENFSEKNRYVSIAISKTAMEIMMNDSCSQESCIFDLATRDVDCEIVGAYDIPADDNIAMEQSDYDWNHFKINQVYKMSSWFQDHIYTFRGCRSLYFYGKDNRVYKVKEGVYDSLRHTR